MFPPEKLSVPKCYEPVMREKQLLEVVRNQCVLFTFRVNLAHKGPTRFRAVQ